MSIDSWNTLEDGLKQKHIITYSEYHELSPIEFIVILKQQKVNYRFILEILCFSTNIGWKVCIVPCIEGPSNQSTQNRFLEAKLYTKIYAWKFIEYQGVLFLDSDTLVVGDFYDLFTVHMNNMIQSNHSFGAARDRPADTYFFISLSNFCISQNSFK